MRLVAVTISDRKLIKWVKDQVEKSGKLNKHKKISQSGGVSTIYTLFKTEDRILEDFLQTVSEGITEPNCDWRDIISVSEYDWTCTDSSMESIIEQFCRARGVEFGAFEPLIPKKWSIYEPLLLLGANTFEHPQWGQLDKDALFRRILDVKFPKLTHIAVNMPIDKADVMRRPTNLVPVYGDFGEVSERIRDAPTQDDFDKALWCRTVQNGIQQTWSPMHTMFSRGNITEKARILRQFPNLDRTLAVDLYAGIGYFTLSYVKNGAKVLCWEINPWSVEALQRNCQLNNFSYKIIRAADDFTFDVSSHEDVSVYIFHESNESAVSRVAGDLPISHINLGLLPSSQQSWSTTRQLLSKSTLQAIVHVHENVHVDHIQEFAHAMATEFNGEVLDVTRVKTIAPDIWHVVVDVQNGKTKK